MNYTLFIVLYFFVYFLLIQYIFSFKTLSVNYRRNAILCNLKRFYFPAMALFDHVNLVYGTVSEFCTPSGCSDMTGPGQR